MMLLDLVMPRMAGRPNAAKRAITEMTTSSSMIVKAKPDFSNGRDGALRRPRPLEAVGTGWPTLPAHSVAPRDAARTAQRAVPTTKIAAVVEWVAAHSPVHLRLG